MNALPFPSEEKRAIVSGQPAWTSPQSFARLQGPRKMADFRIAPGCPSVMALQEMFVQIVIEKARVVSFVFAEHEIHEQI